MASFHTRDRWVIYYVLLPTLCQQGCLYVEPLPASHSNQCPPAKHFAGSSWECWLDCWPCACGAQFLTQPFVVGERVTLMSGGSKVVTGKVESIDPLNTIIRDDDGIPITIPNTVRTWLTVD